MVLFILKCLLTVITIVVDSVTILVGFVFALLLWDKEWMKFTDYYVLTCVLWGKGFEISNKKSE